MPRLLDDPSLPADRDARRKVLTARRMARLRDRRGNATDKVIERVAELGRAGLLTAEHREKLIRVAEGNRP
jgi:hypothetical protein